MEKILKAVDDSTELLISLRRELHRCAQGAWREFAATARIAMFLDELGVEYTLGESNIVPELINNRPSAQELEKARLRAIELGYPEKIIRKMGDYTGLTAVIDSGKQGKTVALRFDIDAIVLEESKSAEHRPVREGFASVNDNACHACGHDGHTAIGLVCAKILAENKECFSGKVKLVFQPAEEGVNGARAMVESGFFDDVDVFLAGHIGVGAKESGLFVANTGGFYATCKQRFVFKGKSAHAAAAPEKGRNALLAAAAAALNVYSLAQDSRGMARVNVGTLNAGTVENIIAERAEMKIESRALNAEICNELRDNVRRVCNAAAQMYGVDVDVSVFGESTTMRGDEELEQKLCSIAKKYKLANKICGKGDFGASEDASWMLERVQRHGGMGCYMMWGADIAEAHHNSMFDFDEAVLPFAVKTVVAPIFEGI